LISFTINLDLFRIRSLTSANKIFDYDNERIALRKHIIANKIRYIGKETNNIDEKNATGIDEEDYTEYGKDQDIVNSKEFNDWVLTLNPKVRMSGIREYQNKP
jgi:hypothetical protein